MNVEAVLSSYAFAPGDMLYCVVTLRGRSPAPVVVEAQLLGLCKAHRDWATLPAKYKEVMFVGLQSRFQQ
jgi:hypothetical protein